MEVDLKGIINKIKEEGVEAAEKKAEDIVERAEEKAETIIVNTERTKENILTQAHEEAERIRQTGRDAVKQASRDVLLGLRENIIELFDRIIKKEVAEQFSPEVLKESIGRIVEAFCKEGKTELEIILKEKDKTVIEKFFLSKLKEKITEGVTLKASPNIESGFRIGKKGKSSYYDFTDEAITEAFKTFLNPKMAKMLELNK